MGKFMEVIIEQEVKEELKAIEKDYAHACWKSWKILERFGVSFEDYWVGLKKVY